jgi:hypothetical protein
LAQQHQRIVDDDPDEPGRESGVFAELLQVHECPLKRALHRVFRILLIAKDAESGAIRFAMMALVEFSESLVVSRLGFRDERLFVAYALSTGGRAQVSNCVYPRLNIEYESNSPLASRCGSTALSHSVLLRSFCSRIPN